MIRARRGCDSMNYVDWHQSNDEGPLANDGSQAWLAALSTMTAEELTQLASVVDAELAQAPPPPANRLLIEDASADSFAERMPDWLRRDRRDDAPSSELLDEAFLAGDVPPPPPTRFLPPALTRRPAPIPHASMRPEASARRVYFAFDFDDLARVEAVRQGLPARDHPAWLLRPHRMGEPRGQERSRSAHAHARGGTELFDRVRALRRQYLAEPLG